MVGGESLVRLWLVYARYQMGNNCSMLLALHLSFLKRIRCVHLLLFRTVLEISCYLSDLCSVSCFSPQDWREPSLCHGWHVRTGSFVLALSGLARLRGRAEVPAWQSLEDR